MNNPVKLTDPTGMTWEDPEEADDLIKKVNKTIESVKGEKAKLQEKLGAEGLDDKKKNNLQKEILQCDKRISSLESTIKDINALGADKNHKYDLTGGGELNYVKKGEDGVINIQGPSDALHIHEIKHVALSLSSEKGLEFSAQGYLKPTTPNGLTDEIAGYSAQYAFMPSSLPGSVKSFEGIDLIISAI